MGPSNVEQYLLIVAFVVPGIVYQTVRARYLGEVPQNREWAAKILRALSASTMLALLYAIAFNKLVARFIASGPDEIRDFARAHAGDLAAWALVLLFAVPAAIARLLATWPTARYWAARALVRLLDRTPADRLAGVRRYATGLEARAANPAGLRSDPTPTAWEWAINHAGSGNGFVRVMDDQGQWWGGAFGGSSYFSEYPEEPAVFAETTWTMSTDGEFLQEQAGTRGAWIPCRDARVVQFLEAGSDTAPSR